MKIQVLPDDWARSVIKSMAMGDLAWGEVKVFLWVDCEPGTLRICTLSASLDELSHIHCHTGPPEALLYEREVFVGPGWPVPSER